MIEDKLNQVCTYWEPGEEDMFGNPSWSAPQVLACRWEDKQKLIRDKTGEQVVSQSEVWIVVQVRDKGRLVKGESADLLPPSDSFEPRKIDELVGLDGQRVGWKVWL